MQMKNFKEDFPLLRENPVAYIGYKFGNGVLQKMQCKSSAWTL